MEQRPRFRSWTAVLVLTAVHAGCESRGPDVLQEFPPPRLASRSRLPGPVRLIPAPQGQLNIETRGLGLEPLGVPISGGFVEFDPEQLDTFRGKLEVDLLQLESPSAESPSAALSLLEPSGPPGGRRRERLRRATFSVDSAFEGSTAALRLVRPRRIDDQPFGEVTLSVRGQLELHGHRAEQTARIRLRFPFRDGEPDVRQVQLTSVEPMTVSLPTFGIAGGRGRAPSARIRADVMLLATER